MKFQHITDDLLRSAFLWGGIGILSLIGIVVCCFTTYTGPFKRNGEDEKAVDKRFLGIILLLFAVVIVGQAYRNWNLAIHFRKFGKSASGWIYNKAEGHRYKGGRYTYVEYLYSAGTRNLTSSSVYPKDDDFAADTVNLGMQYLVLYDSTNPTECVMDLTQRIAN